MIIIIITFVLEIKYLCNIYIDSCMQYCTVQYSTVYSAKSSICHGWFPETAGWLTSVKALFVSRWAIMVRRFTVSPKRSRRMHLAAA